MKLIVCNLVKLFSKISSHIKWPLKLRIILNDNIHKFVFSKLSPYFVKTNNILNNNKNDSTNCTNSGIIWMFWWQGYSNMPLIVKCCVHSVIKHANGHKVILISKRNIHIYAKIPNYIYEKLNKGHITFTHFSDILRFNLLRNYGGLWIDSTMYCVRDLNNNYFSKFYTSGPGGKGINKYHDFVSDKWTGFLIGGCKNNPIFNFMDTFFKLYWKDNNHQIDYFLIDYALYYIYLNNINGFFSYVNHVAYFNNPHLHDLLNYLNNPFNIRLYDIMIKDTDLFKLTYKKHFNKYNTFYQKLLKESKL